MKYLLLIILSLLISGCSVQCDCGCSNCGPNCVNQCDGLRCIPGEPCCEDCKCKK